MKYLFLYTVISFLPIAMMAQNGQNIAAASGLEKYKKLILLQPRKENQLTASDTSSLILGRPLPTAIVPLDRLKKYQSGQSADSIITDIDELIYPVINGKDRSVSGTLTLTKKNDVWAATRFGADRAVIQSATDSLSVPGRSYRLVKILAFHKSFLSYSDAGILMFIPLQEDSAHGIIKGRTITAASALENYVKAANDYNGLPM
jgi:hypothetical protein